jgi:hypothetical protein
MNKEELPCNESKCKNKNEMKDLTNDKITASIPFWSDDPNILFKQEYIFEFFPTENMTYEQKMNSISRLVIFLTIIGFIFSQNIRLVIISIITMGSIFLIYNYQKKEHSKMESKKINLEGQEGFEGPALEALKKSNIPIPDKTVVFDEPSATNPFSNVLMTDYDFNPNKKPAAPSYNENVAKDILGQAKQLVRNANPDDPYITDKLFKGLGEELEFEQSMRQFVSNPATTIPNDQKAFAEFCYGSMISSKEGNLFALARNLSRHQT